MSKVLTPEVSDVMTESGKDVFVEYRGGLGTDYDNEFFEISCGKGVLFVTHHGVPSIWFSPQMRTAL